MLVNAWGKLEIAACVELSRSVPCNYPQSLQLPLWCRVVGILGFVFVFCNVPEAWWCTCFAECASVCVTTHTGEPLQSCWIFTYTMSSKGYQQSWEQPPGHHGKISYSTIATDEVWDVWHLTQWGRYEVCCYWPLSCAEFSWCTACS